MLSAGCQMEIQPSAVPSIYMSELFLPAVVTVVLNKSKVLPSMGHVEICAVISCHYRGYGLLLLCGEQGKMLCA